MAPKMFGVDEAYSIEDIRNYIFHKVTKNPDSLIYYDTQSSPPVLDKTINAVIQKNEFKVICSLMFLITNFAFSFFYFQYLQMYQPIKHFLHNLRLTKSPVEQELMRQAGKISSEAIEETMRITKPGMTEHQLFAKVDYEVKIRGAAFLAYPPVVAAGNNATIIHYIDNNQMIKDGDLILMDAGRREF